MTFLNLVLEVFAVTLAFCQFHLCGADNFEVFC